MKDIYILSSVENIDIALKILKGIKNIRIYNNANPKSSLTRATYTKMSQSDIILAIIDNSFFSDANLNFEYSMAEQSVINNRNQIIIPIIIDDSISPSRLHTRHFINYYSNDDKSIVASTEALKNILNHHDSAFKKHNIFFKKNISISLTLFFTCSIYYVLLFCFNHYNLISNQMFYMSKTIILVLMTILVLLIPVIEIFNKRRTEEKINEDEFNSNRIRQALDTQKTANSNTDDKPSKEIDALGRMMLNLEDIKEYYTWSQKQAKRSFGLAVTMCVFGFVLMSIAIVVPMILNVSFEMSLLPAIGGVITELIAGTALFVYKNSLQQLNHYHRALHEDERFLSSVNLLNNFNNENMQDEMLKEIIRSELEMNITTIKNECPINKTKNHN